MQTAKGSKLDGVTRAKLENGTKRNRTTSQHIKIGEIGKIGVQQNRQAKMGDKLFNHTGSSLKAFRAEYTTAASTFNQMWKQGYSNMVKTVFYIMLINHKDRDKSLQDCNTQIWTETNQLKKAIQVFQ